MACAGSIGGRAGAAGAVRRACPSVPAPLPGRNRPCTRPWPFLPDSTRDTPLVRSTTSRSPRSTFLPLRHHHIAGERDGIGLHVEYAGSPVAVCSFCVTTTPPRASSRLIFCWPPGPGSAAFRVLLLSAALAVLLVEHHQRLAAHRGVALGHAHIAAECRHLVLVAHFQRRRLDMHRLVAVLRKALQRVGRPLRRGCACSGAAGQTSNAAATSSDQGRMRGARSLRSGLGRRRRGLLSINVMSRRRRTAPARRN